MSSSVTPVQCLRTAPTNFWARSDEHLRHWFTHPDYAHELWRQCLGDDEALRHIVRRQLVPRVTHRCWLVVKEGIDSPEERRGRADTRSDRPRRQLSWYERLMNRLTLARTGRYTHVELCFQVSERQFGADYRLHGETPQVYERIQVSLHSGVVRKRISAASDYMPSYTVRLLAVSEHRRMAMYLFCMLQEGKPFDRVGYFLNHTPVLNRAVSPTSLDQRRWLCSEMTAVALRLGDDRYQYLDPKRCSPSELYAAVSATDTEMSTGTMTRLNTDREPLLYDPELAQRQRIIL